MVASASRFVVIYLLGRIGAPPAAEMYTNVETCSLDDSCAKAMAICVSALVQVKLEGAAIYKPESLFISS